MAANLIDVRQRHVSSALWVGVSRDWLSFADSCTPVRERICFGGFVMMSVVYLLYLMMLILHLECDRSALSTCSGTSAYQYWRGGNLQIQVAITYKRSFCSLAVPAETITSNCHVQTVQKLPFRQTDWKPRSICQS
jgi:hypothetical protein